MFTPKKFLDAAKDSDIDVLKACLEAHGFVS